MFNLELFYLNQYFIGTLRYTFYSRVYGTIKITTDTTKQTETVILLATLWHIDATTNQLLSHRWHVHTGCRDITPIVSR